MPDFLKAFADTFASLQADNLHRLAELYSEDVEFRDPLHEVHGLADLEHYFSELYQNLRELRIDLHGWDTAGEDSGYLRWTLHYRHPRLAGGRPIALRGCSYLRWRQQRVYLHHDYFDAGALLYEHLPVFGGLIRWLKRRLA